MNTGATDASDLPIMVGHLTVPLACSRAFKRESKVKCSLVLYSPKRLADPYAASLAATHLQGQEWRCFTLDDVL